MTFREAVDLLESGGNPLAGWGLTASQCHSFILQFGAIISRASGSKLYDAR